MLGKVWPWCSLGVGSLGTFGTVCVQVGVFQSVSSVESRCSDHLDQGQGRSLDRNLTRSQRVSAPAEVYIEQMHRANGTQHIYLHAR